ncbi:MAG: 6-phosphogluconolactonase, partial [Bacteroidota bacterium]
MNTRVYKDKQEVAEQFSQYIEELVNKHNKISIALSGGSTPKVVFDYLAANYQGLDWSKVRLFWGDERCVPPTHNESNYKMTVDHLLSKINIPEENIFRVKGENSPGEEAVAYDQLLQNKLPIVNGIPQFDLVILGMGSDGHTASIFPHEIELWNSENS